jgi:hypothetical protein
MFLVQVMMEDMPIVRKQWLFEEEYFADRKVKSLIEAGEDEYNVVKERIQVEDAFYAKPSTSETRKAVWGEQYA